MMRGLRESPPNEGTGRKGKGDGGTFEVFPDSAARTPDRRTQDILQVVAYLIALAAPFIAASTLE